MKRFSQVLSYFSLSTEACSAEWVISEPKFPISITQTVNTSPNNVEQASAKHYSQF